MKGLALFLGLFLFLVNGRVDYTSRTPPAVAVLHGMGGTCASQSMTSATQTVRETMLNSYVHCFMFGDTPDEDAKNTYVLTMNEQVEMFAEMVKASDSFKDGFNAVAYSQGTLVVRGYIQRFSWRDDYPSVFSFLSIHGPIMGVATLSDCVDGTISPSLNFLCDDPKIVYSRLIQNTVAQSNFFKFPLLIDQYLKTNFLPVLNGEVKMPDDIKGLDSLEQLVLVKALKETVVIPKDSSWMGFYKDGSQQIIENFNESILYEEDRFGLRSLDEDGKLFFETTPRGHVQVSKEELVGLLNKYWLPNWKWEKKVIVG